MSTSTIKNEYLLQYIWNLRLVPQRGIFTQCQRKIRIINPGHLNLNDGPDFLDAEIIIDNEIWFGHVEVHINSSDWITHGHSRNVRYNNVILHVVLKHDCDIYYPDGSLIPTVEVKKILPKNFTSTYLALIYNSKNLPCADLQSDMPELHFSKWMETLALERMVQKVNVFLTALKNNAGNWEETIYQALLTGMGGKVNKQGFEILAEKIPLKLIRLHSHNTEELEILFLGQAGLLGYLSPQYDETQASNTFNHFKRKYELAPMKSIIWLKKGVRPMNQPHARIRQFCKFLFKKQYFLDSILSLRDISEYKTYLSTHEHKYDCSEEYRIGENMIDILIINSIAPILFAYGKVMQTGYYCERAVELWSLLKAEKNTITSLWKSLGRKAISASESQAMNQLENNYCLSKRCHQCAIGHFIMKKSQIQDKKLIYKTINR